MKKTTTVKKCIICGKEIIKPFWRAKSVKFCSQECNGLSKRGANHFAFKGGKPKCVDCGKQLVVYKAKRCKSCVGKKRIFSKETRKKISLSNKGKKVSQEVIEKIRNKLIGRKAWNKGLSKYRNFREYKKRLNERRRVRYKTLTKEERLADLVRTRIRNALRYCSKKSSTLVLLGCSICDFKNYLESKFKDGMNWNNYGNGKGNWNIDHIVPISRFDLLKKEEQKKAFHYLNCQPMWSVLNFKKGNR